MMHMNEDIKTKVIIELHVILTIEPINFRATRLGVLLHVHYNTLTTLTCIELEHAQLEVIDYE